MWYYLYTTFIHMVLDLSLHATFLGVNDRGPYLQLRLDPLLLLMI